MCVCREGGAYGEGMMWDWWVETAKIDHVSRTFADANGNGR